MPAGYVSLHPSQTSYSEDGILTTNYLDDYIVRGKIFNISLAQSMTADTPLYFTSEYSDPAALNGVFLLPIAISPVSGYCILNIYEATEYTGGSAIAVPNRNRTSDNVAAITVLGGASGTTKGTLIFTGVFGVDALKASAGGGGGSSTNAIVLDKEKKYLYEVTNTETAIVGISVEFAEI